MTSSPPCSTTTGFLRTPSVDRIATCGWLMIGAVMKVPNEPELESVVGTARQVVGPEGAVPCPALARVRMPRASSARGLMGGVADDRSDEALEV